MTTSYSVIDMGWLSIGKSLAKTAAKSAAKREKAWMTAKDPLMTPKPVPVKTAIKDLPNAHGVTQDYVKSLIGRVRDEESAQRIAEYLRSDAAKELTASARTKLLIACLDKLKYLETLKEFL